MATILQGKIAVSLSLLLSEPLFTQREPLLWQPSYKSEKYKDIEQLDNLYFKTPNLREINCVLQRIDMCSVTENVFILHRFVHR